MRLKDGTPGQQTWDATWGAEELLGEDLLAQLLTALEKEMRTDG